MNGRIVGAVALGGAVGSVVRLLIGMAMQSRIGAAFPLGTFVINVTGSALLKFLVQLALDTSAITPVVRALLTTGFCGGYTTFSTFSYETAGLINEGLYGRAAVYSILSVLLALARTFCGRGR